jgi:predicted nucleic acid-binding protein
MMQYFDTDVLVHFVINQDLSKHRKAQELILQAAKSNTFFISFLSLNEFAFVLTKLKVEKNLIERNLDVFLTSSPKDVDLDTFQRARIIAEKVGYHNFSDCIHTSIAEKFCNELFTFNKNDFKRIEKYTELKIKIL